MSIGGNFNGTLADNVTIRFVTDNTGPWFLHWWVLSFHHPCRGADKFPPQPHWFSFECVSSSERTAVEIVCWVTPQGIGYRIRRECQWHSCRWSSHTWVLRPVVSMSSDDIVVAAAWKELCPAYNNFICESCWVVRQASSDDSCQRLNGMHRILRAPHVDLR